MVSSSSSSSELISIVTAFLLLKGPDLAVLGRGMEAARRVEEGRRSDCICDPQSVQSDPEADLVMIVLAAILRAGTFLTSVASEGRASSLIDPKVSIPDRVSSSHSFNPSFKHSPHPHSP
jgi:hypothetical protein